MRHRLRTLILFTNGGFHFGKLSLYFSVKQGKLKENI